MNRDGFLWADGLPPGGLWIELAECTPVGNRAESGPSGEVPPEHRHVLEPALAGYLGDAEAGSLQQPLPEENLLRD